MQTPEVAEGWNEAATDLSTAVQNQALKMRMGGGSKGSAQTTRGPAGGGEVSLGIRYSWMCLGT